MFGLKFYQNFYAFPVVWTFCALLFLFLPAALEANIDIEQMEIPEERLQADTEGEGDDYVENSLQ